MLAKYTFNKLVVAICLTLVGFSLTSCTDDPMFNCINTDSQFEDVLKRLSLDSFLKFDAHKISFEGLDSACYQSDNWAQAVYRINPKLTDQEFAELLKTLKSSGNWALEQSDSSYFCLKSQSHTPSLHLEAFIQEADVQDRTSIFVGLSHASSSC